LSSIMVSEAMRSVGGMGGGASASVGSGLAVYIDGELKADPPTFVNLHLGIPFPDWVT